MFSVKQGLRCGVGLSTVLLASLLSACGGGAHHDATLPSLGGTSSGPVGPAAGQRKIRSINGSTFQQECASPVRKKAACTALLRLSGPSQTHKPLGGRRTSASDPIAGGGWWPGDIVSAYALPDRDPTIGSSVTVAIVDAFDAPTVEADLATYRSYFGLPPCTTANGCFKKVNSSGYQGSYPPSGVGTGWSLEAALDVEAVSATCANCKIVLVESDSDYLSDLANAENTAATLGGVISNSYYAPEVDPFAQPGDPPTTTYKPSYNHPGIVILAGTGDNGFQTGGNAPFPAGSGKVVAVGGTALSNATNARGWSEVAWSASGGGCSTLFPKQTYQTDPGCALRMTADVSATADGLAVYDSEDLGGWGAIGGTSASTPIVAAVYALGGNPSTVVAASTLYAHPGNLFDVTTGSTGTCSPAYFCTAGAGYDGPTGLGSPNGTLAFGGTAKQWHQLPGTATDVAAGDFGLWVVGGDGTSVLDFVAGNFVANGPGTAASRVTMDPSGVPYTVTQDGRMWNHSSGSWAPVLCCATDLGVGPNQDMWFIQPGGTVYEFGSRGGGVRGVNGARIAVSGDGIPWMVDTAGNISSYAYGVWNAYGCCFSDVAAGNNGVVYATGADRNSVWQLSSSYTWIQVRTGGANISVTPTKGIPYVTDASGNLFVFD
jgi:hypothetical protein